MITSWSPGAEKLLGWTELEIIGGDACLIITPEDLEAGACAGEMATAQRDVVPRTNAGTCARTAAACSHRVC